MKLGSRILALFIFGYFIIVLCVLSVGLMLGRRGVITQRFSSVLARKFAQHDQVSLAVTEDYIALLLYQNKTEEAAAVSIDLLRRVEANQIC